MQYLDYIKSFTNLFNTENVHTSKYFLMKKNNIDSRQLNVNLKKFLSSLGDFLSKTKHLQSNLIGQFTLNII